MKKLISMILCCVILLALTGCAGTTVVVGNCTCPPESHEPALTPTAAPGDATDNAGAEGMLMTGLAILPEVSGKNATAENNGTVSYDVTVVAVTVDNSGIIRDCVIDSVGADAAFDAAGVPAAPGTTEVKSKNEKGADYGMVNASKIGKEWFEQARAVADYAVGKTVEELKNGAVNESGKAKDADLATKATMPIGGYIDGIVAAVANAKPLGAGVGQELKLAVNASADAAEGSAQLNLDAVALTLNGEIISSCTIDSLQAKVEFDGIGTITTDLTVAPKTKNQLQFDYNMVNFGVSTMEWFQQTEFFCAYVTGKTAADVAGIQVNAEYKPVDVDLKAGCTIAIGDFQKLIAKAAN